MGFGDRFMPLALIFLLVDLSESTGPLFVDIAPPLVSLFGGNTLNITGSNFPTPAAGSGISCRWQESLVLSGTRVSSSLIQCPVPSVFRFTAFSTDTLYQLDNLAVSFDMFSNVSEEVITPFSDLALQFRAIADELAPMSVWPHRTFANYVGLVLDISWSNLPLDLPPSFPPLCRFTVISRAGRYGRALSVQGVILNSTTIECTAPTLTEIDPSVTAPADVLIHISFDSGQTFSVPHTSLRYLPDILVSTSIPELVVDAGGTWITLIGSGFLTSAQLECRFDQPASNTHLKAHSVKYLNESSIACKIPFTEPPMPEGDYQILLTVDGIHYINTGRVFRAISTPETTLVSPTRGYFHGGTVVSVTGVNIGNDSESTQCLFGNAPARMYRFINSSLIQCLAPACALAVDDFSSTADPATCTGIVAVSVIYAGTGFGGVGGSMLGNAAFYEYVVRQKIIAFDPWYASAWDKPFPVRVYGNGFQRPFFCRWLDLPSFEAVTVAGNIADGPGGSDSYADCVAPVLPESITPTTASGLDSLLAYVEVSCNDQDFTIDRTQWLFVKPPTVVAVTPNQVWAGSARTGGVFVYGTNFKGINREALSCLWFYTGTDDSVFEITPATFIDKSTLFCEPETPAAVDALFVKVEVRIAPNVESDSGVGLQVVPAPVIDSVVSLGGLQGPYLGGDILQLVASNLNFADTYIVVGDSAMIPDSVTGTIRVPPASHEDLAVKPITLLLERQNRLVVGQYVYAPVEVGEYYRPAIHEGISQTCRPGTFCPGMYPSESSVAITSGISASECPPGSFQSEAGGVGCKTCVSPSYCPRTGQDQPTSCPQGKVCWGQSGNDAELTVCPIGKLCLLPEPWAIPTEIPEEVDPFRDLREVGSGPPIRQLLQVTPSNVTAIECPSGLVCGPDSTGVGVGYTSTLLSIIQAMFCAMPNVYCAPGSGSPHSLEGLPFLTPGSYITAGGSSLTSCPQGFTCDGLTLEACAPGSFQNELGSTECKVCTGGTVCPSSGLALPYKCPTGYACSLPGRTEPSYLCPAGAYCLEGIITLSPNSGSLSPVLCSNGTYCSPGTSSSVIDINNPSAPRTCALGFYCEEGAKDYTGSGACPRGYYCEAGSSMPIPAPPGSFVDYEGAYTPTLCAPGTYQEESGQASCKQCPDGFECPLEGMTGPSPCPAAHYRAKNDSSFTATENVVCHPCQEGTWSWRTQLVSSSECLLCPERYVCGRQGMTVFATKDQVDCEPNPEYGGNSICYSLSQASDCPEGFACDAGTTSFTQYNYPCEAGYFCKPLTALREMRNLLCPQGFVCKEATGASKAYSSVCPVGSFCPEGTAGVDLLDGSQILFNVQATDHVGAVDSDTGAECRKCDPNSFDPPSDIETSSCLPCGVINTNGTYIPNVEWESLLCPDGTTSERGAVSPDDCEQQGIILAVVNVYNRTAVVENDGMQTPLWSQDREYEWISNPDSRESLQFGLPVSATTSYVVDFLGFDPRIETLAYTGIPTRALDIVRLDFDFTKVPEELIMATTKSAGAGAYKLLISSDKLSSGSSAWSSYILPYTLDQSDGKQGVRTKFSLKLLALMDEMKINVSIALLDGGHYKDMHTFNDAVSVSVSSPNRAQAYTRNSFYAVVSADSLNNGGFELPYNLIPTFANQPGDISLVSDLADQVNYTTQSELVNTMIPGTTFWKVAGASTVAVPWLPFFSNCDYFDKHIVLWDLFEGNTKVPPEAGECYTVPNQDDVEIVAPLIYDFATGAIRFQSNSDWCEVALKCRYEDNLAYSSGSSQPWMFIDGTGSTPLFFITRDPWAFSDAGAPDFQSSIGRFDSLEGTDSLVPVMLDSSQRTGQFPRLISLKIDYAQITKTQKRIVTASISFNNFDDNTDDRNYLLQVSFEPMNWVQMMNAFQLEWYVYAAVFILSGLSVVGLGIVFWVILNGIKSLSKSARTAMPRFALLDCYTFFMMYALQGVLVSSVPFVIVTGFIKLITLPELGFLATLPCTFDRGPSSTSSPLLTGVFDPLVCSRVRTGTCLIVSGVFTLWSGSKYFVPRLPASHKEYVESASVQKLQDDGIVVLARKDERVLTVVAWKRFHIFLTSVLICLPLMVLFAFSYSAMFGNFTVYYSVGYTMTMLMADLLFIKIAREKLAFNYFAVITDVVFFVATLSAEDLNAFVLSYLFGTYFISIERIVAEDVIGFIYEDTIPGTIKWIRTRKFVWNTMLWVQKVMQYIRHAPTDDIKLLEFTEAPPKQVVAVSKTVEEIGSLDDDIDQVAGIASRVLSLVFGPFAVLLVWIFAKETQFAANYGLMLSSIPYYLMFSVLVIPFQIALELAINHAFDATKGTRIYDYMYLCMWRWKSRLTRWLLDDARLDSSLGQSTQALHHLAFSPQFYFIVIYAVYGGVFLTYGITCWIANGVPAFLDPATGLLVILTLVAQRFADAVGRWLVFYVLWKPADRAPEKAFVQSVALGLKQKELEEHEVAFKNFFFQRHRDWVIEHLDKVYTPRGIAKYRSQLNEIYQKVLSIRIPYLYTAPVQKPTAFTIEEPSDDKPDDFDHPMDRGNDMMEVPLDSDAEDGDAALTRNAPVTYSLVQGWLEVARKRARKKQMKIRKSGPIFPGHVMVQLTDSSKEVIKEWLAKVRQPR